LAPSRWDIVDIDFGDPIGHEQAWVRPAVVLSHDGLNRNARLAVVCPITGARTAPRFPSEVVMPNMPGILTPGLLYAHQIRTVSTDRVLRIRGPLKDPVLQREIITAVLGVLDIPIE